MSNLTATQKMMVDRLDTHSKSNIFADDLKYPEMSAYLDNCYGYSNKLIIDNGNPECKGMFRYSIDPNFELIDGSIFIPFRGSVLQSYIEMYYGEWRGEVWACFRSEHAKRKFESLYGYCSDEISDPEDIMFMKLKLKRVGS